jgi:bifunctional non-homologous end joining protein LigD
MARAANQASEPDATVADLPPRGNTLLTIDGTELKLTNLHKVLYPEAEFAKRDVLDYYRRVAPAILPHLAGRPVSLKRYPNGVDKPFFWTKDCPAGRPEWVRTLPVWTPSSRRDTEFCVVDNLPTLLWLANLAALELHVALARADDLQRPTALVFDLDPGPPANVVQCAGVSLWIRALLAELGLECFVKTSGSKGLQLYAPLNSAMTYEQTKPFAHWLAVEMERRHPDLVVSKMTRDLRSGKVLIDWSQNDDHKTTVCVYSLRAKARPTVSTPLTWEEVERAVRKQDPALLVFEAADLLKRVARHGDPFEPLLVLRQNLPAVPAEHRP